MAIQETVTTKVAVIGGGPAGLVMARWLLQHGCEPTVFEAGHGIGGQWNPDCPTSATRQGLSTNTCRDMSRFSDLDHADEVPLYPSQLDMLHYLQCYADHFDLARHVRTDSPVRKVDRAGDRFVVTLANPGGREGELFDRVVCASGYEAAPSVPAIAGLDGFDGMLGVFHSRQFRSADRFRGRTVVVAGCSVSALEIASALAAGGARRVISSARRQRYVLPKITAGQPLEAALMTRMAALQAMHPPPETGFAAFGAKVVEMAGNPSRYGARAADAHVGVAGITQSQSFLPLVAEGAIGTAAWIDRIDGSTVRFADGQQVKADAIIFATGFRPDLRALAGALPATLRDIGHAPDLFGHSFHPDSPGLAFLSIYNLVGPKLPVLELQARWIAQVLAGKVALPARPEMDAEIAANRAQRLAGMDLPMHMAAIDFAKRAGVDPDVSRWTEIARPLLFGPLVPAVFRLEGPDALPHAADEVRDAAARLSGIADNSLAPAEAGQLAAIGDAAGFGPALAQLVIDAEDRARPRSGAKHMVGAVVLALLALANLTIQSNAPIPEPAPARAAATAAGAPLHSRDDGRSV